MISLVPLHAVDRVFPAVFAWVEKACRKARSNRTAPEIYAMCRNGSMWLALATDEDRVIGCIVMSIYEVQGERTLQYVIIGGEGDVDEWFDELLYWDWITSMGIKRIVSEGRPSWPRRLKHIVPDLKVIRVQFEWEHVPRHEIVMHDEAERAARGYDA